MATQPDVRQIVSREALDRIGPDAAPGTPTELKDILESINFGVTPPLELRETATPDQFVQIGNITLQDPHLSVNKIIPPISNSIPAFTSGNVEFPVASGGSATPSVGDPIVITMSNDSFLKVGISLNPLGNLILQAGVEGATAALATAPATVSSTHSIGFILLETVGTVIQTVTNARIFQYVGGASSSGSGDASSVITRLWDQFEDSIYAQLTGVDFTIDQSDHVDLTNSTGAFSLASNNFEFSASSETLETTNLLSQDEFIDEGGSIGRTRLTVFWDEDNTDAGATYEISPDGGVTYSAITMDRVGTASDSFTGDIHVDPLIAKDEFAFTGDNGDQPFNDTVDAQAQLFTTTRSLKINRIRIVGRNVNAITGNLTVQIVNDNAGEPGVTVYATSTAVDTSTVGASDQDIDFDFAGESLDAGTYFFRIDGDATYLANKTASDFITFNRDTTGTGISTLVGATWTAAGRVFEYSLNATAAINDMRVKITSSAGDVAIAGYGLFYEPTAGVSLGAKNVKSFSFQSNSENLNAFDLAFYADPDLLTIYWVESGQAFRAPAFTLSGTIATFPVNFFIQGSDETVTLIASQNDGNSFDNSDQNATDISELQSSPMTISGLKTFADGITVTGPTTANGIVAINVAGEHVLPAGASTVDATGINTIFCGSGVTATINNISNGTSGQMLWIINGSGSSNLTLKHNNTTGGDAFLMDPAADRNYTGYGIVQVILRGTIWYIVEGPAH